MANSKKKLSMAAIKKQDKQFDERYEVEINGYVLEIDQTFRPTKIQGLISELAQKFEETKVQDTNILDIFTPYMILLMIKNFTSLDIPDKLDDQLKTLDFLVDNDFLVPIYESLPIAEVNKVYAEMEAATDRINDNINELKQSVNGLTLENREMLGLD
ncbi:hypothetical protein M2277_005127 [Paenibacillus sp. LBL]|uniref:hypothetical protein n=1 Tax=Paenibacillus sp. LBL TaxID=2940563 RepID=UPI002474A988|nr:hypothetical protein [Paenibacillus sp. LBL]MDH6674435.1 hypothetical protein [Paenibacillus sp. LBL]